MLPNIAKKNISMYGSQGEVLSRGQQQLVGGLSFNFR
jgi:hypothetical protein